MALTKISSNEIQPAAITSDLISADVSLGVKISNVSIANSSYTILDDTAVNVDGGYIVITGAGFNSGAQVIIEGTNATSVTRVSSTELRAQVPAKSAATYNVYVVNTDGSTGIRVNGLTYSATPSWVTGSTLDAQELDIAFNISFDATSATSYANSSELPAGTTLLSNGYLYGTITGIEDETTYSFTVVATDAENQDSPRTFSVTVSVGDPYFNSTVLLLQADNTNNTNNQTFLDSSTNNLTVTKTGNPRMGSFSPFSPAGWSGYFDGSGDELNTIGTTSSFNFIHQANGKFTLEFWAYPTAAGTLFDNTSGTSNQTGIWAGMGANNTVRCFITKSSGLNWIVDGWSTTALELNSWNHFVITYDHSLASDNMKFYVNGSPAGTLTKTANVPATGDASNAFRIGGAGSGGYSGYISNFRIVNDVVYSSTFSSPTSDLIPIANTHLLTCQSNRFIDNSNNSYSISSSGETKVKPFSPFSPSARYNVETHGASCYFDGTDYFDFTRVTPTDFTAECWVYMDGQSPQRHSLFGDTYNGGDTNVQLTVYNNGAIDFILSATIICTAPAGTVKLNEWNHIAFVRSGSDCVIFANGEKVATGTHSGNAYISRVGWIGYQLGNFNLIGYMSDVRISNTAIYDTAQTTVTIPSAPITTDANTIFLLKFDKAGIYDGTTKNVLETAGDAKINTSVKKYGTGSLAFDGTGDYLLMSSNPTNLLSTGDFTIECWVNVTTQASYPAIFSNGNWAANKWALHTNHPTQSNKFSFWVYNMNNGAAMLVSSTTVSTGTWYHVAVVRDGSSLKMYVNGTLESSATSSTSLDGNVLTNFYLSYDGTNSGAFLNGYLDDVRITKGVARYTTNFTAPEKTFFAR
jgi:hypothetical protein